MEHTKEFTFVFKEDSGEMLIVALESTKAIASIHFLTDDETTKSNAERIVKTWNSHDELVKQNKELLVALINLSEEVYSDIENSDEGISGNRIYQRALKAINNAKS